MSRFGEREPKTPRELEIFYRQTREKLSNTDSSLSEVEMMALCSANTPENYDYAIQLLQLQVDELRTQIAMLTNPEYQIKQAQQEAETAITLHGMGA
jgi:hypothetical protein